MMRNIPRWWLGAVGMAVALSACSNKGQPSAGRSPKRHGKLDARAQPAQHGKLDARARPSRRRARPGRLLAVDIIEKATAALGGSGDLREALRRHEIESRGIYRGKAYTAHAYVSAPRAHLLEVSMKTAGRTTTTTMGSVGETCWSKSKGKVHPCSARLNEALVYMRKAAHFATLWPFLGAGYTLDRKGVINLNGKPTYAIEAYDCLQPGVTLYFDKTTFKFVRYRWKGRLHGHSKVGTIVVTIQAYKKIGSVTIPWKRVMTFNGRKVLEDEVTKVKFGKVDAAKLVKPAGVPRQPLDPQ
jgi:hypothetical protein